jgi:CubicO group peptidase (beta-lactamase class C family)
MRTSSCASLVLLGLGACAGSPASPPAVAPTPAAALAPAATTPPPPAAPVPPSLTGIWLGTLPTPGKGLRLQLHLDLSKTPAGCALDSLDQHADGIPCENVVAAASTVSFDVGAVHGKLAGTVSADGNTIDGTWTQGPLSLPLVLTRQATAIAAPQEALDPAMPPVAVADLRAVLDADLASALARGELAPATGAGITVGVYAHGARSVLPYGAAKADSVFEIGSITKTFTGLLLAQMAEQKRVRLDEPVRALLPPGTVDPPASGAEITLLDLSAQRSGMPHLPDNLKPADVSNPYVDYDAKALYAFLKTHGVARPGKPEFGYSNLGVGLLGQALADRAGTSYEALLKREVLGPLGMRDTAVKLTPSMKARFLPGHDVEHKPAGAWDFDALAGAGAIRSTAADMLTYLEAQLHADHLPAAARATPEGKTLPAAIAASHEVRDGAGDGMHVALNWLRVDETGSYWHNGGTAGYSAFAVFNPEKDFAVVVLCNTGPGSDSFADKVARHVVERLEGEPAVSLGPAGK